ncbi:MAG TPA: Uma2 family endonuclease [Tepidisphaeraceae bacterium]|jgi:Uma2 family endonuclease|nr:Uma2 family endonuclease [Tepidisphaeraceae bacterium]
MTTLTEIHDERQHLVLTGVSWAYYEQTLKEIGNQPIRVAFLDGVMELMSPLPQHEGPKKAIASLVVLMAVERQIPLKSLGSSTFRREQKAAGSEPDECFYFNEIDSVRGMKRFDPAVHRAPDLWVEVDVLNPSVPREPIYARLGVPEVWRYEHNRLTVRLLTASGIYADSATSAVFPFLPMAEFAAFIPKMIDGDELTTLTEFRQWVGGLLA